MLDKIGLFRGAERELLHSFDNALAETFESRTYGFHTISVPSLILRGRNRDMARGFIRQAVEMGGHDYA